MKVSEITGRTVNVQQPPDHDECHEYVSRFLAAFRADADEDGLLDLLYAIHIEIRARHDLYFSVFERLTAAQRRAIHEAVTRHHRRMNERPAYKDPDWFCAG